MYSKTHCTFNKESQHLRNIFDSCLNVRSNFERVIFSGWLNRRYLFRPPNFKEKLKKFNIWRRSMVQIKLPWIKEWGWSSLKMNIRSKMCVTALWICGVVFKTGGLDNYRHVYFRLIFNDFVKKDMDVDTDPKTFHEQFNTLTCLL